ncbi:PTS sugar transporter subunit IIA [Oceanobacillus luteolus]|uniref:PTS sugar transporter subunit IIA n=1 Tax=Oceanobacillus luteolus TaxID=1274358 RepID=A0ABW4HWP6_9BACI
MYVEADLVFYGQPLANQNELFDFMADELEKKKYVTKDFREAIKLREKEFPTGLSLGDFNVAIAHTDTTYSRAQKLVVVKPEQSIEFKNIQDLQPLDVDIVFGLILNDSDKHLEVLQKLSNILQDRNIIKKIKNVKSQDELISLMQNHFNE